MRASKIEVIVNDVEELKFKSASKCDNNINETKQENAPYRGENPRRRSEYSHLQ